MLATATARHPSIASFFRHTNSSSEQSERPPTVRNADSVRKHAAPLPPTYSARTVPTLFPTRQQTSPGTASRRQYPNHEHRPSDSVGTPHQVEARQRRFEFMLIVVTYRQHRLVLTRRNRGRPSLARSHAGTLRRHSPCNPLRSFAQAAAPLCPFFRETAPSVWAKGEQIPSKTKGQKKRDHDQHSTLR